MDLQAEALEGSAALEWASALVSAPRLALGAEVIQLCLVHVHHLAVRAGFAQLSVCVVERLVASVQQVQFRVVQRRVLVDLSVFGAQEARPEDNKGLVERRAGFVEAFCIAQKIRFLTKM